MTEEEHLNQLCDSVKDATEKTRKLTEGLSPEQLLWKLGPTKWGMAECFEHLILTGKAWHPNIRTALQEAEATRSRQGRTYRPTLFGRFFLGTVGRNVRLRIPTGPLFEPGARVSADAPERFLGQQQELLQLIEDVRGVNLRATRVSFPQWPWLNLRLGEALALMVHHQHRHLRQAENVMQQDDFPLIATGVEPSVAPG